MLRAIFYANFLCHQMKVSSIFFSSLLHLLKQNVPGRKKKVSRITRALQIMQRNK